MEKLDKNTIIGLILLFVLFGVYTYFESSKPQPANTEASKKNNAPAQETLKKIATAQNATAISDSVPEKTFKVENKDLIVTFSTKGASIRKVELKNYSSYSAFKSDKKEPMVIFDGTRSGINYQLPVVSGSVDLSGLAFNTNNTDATVGANPSVVTFTANSPAGVIEKTYTIKTSGFEIIQNLKMADASKLKSGASAQLIWSHNYELTENDLSENRKSAQINYFDKEENFEDIGLGSAGNEDEDAELPVKWMSFKQKYFTSGVIAEKMFFDKAKFLLETPEKDSSIVKTGKATLDFAGNELAKGVELKYYFGPNDLNNLKAAGNDFQKNLYLGYDIVKPINRYIFVPLFNWVESFVSNYGLLIIIVVLIIKLVLTPLIYKSYVSSAKMRVLGPEINAIKERVGDDAMKVQQETMKLYQQVGVSPLSGCVPLLLQMPILMSVFFLFPNMTMFRQKGFLWASDLSTYDAPISWSYNLPIIGNHISLFVVLMTISSLAFTYYNNQVTPDQPGPIDMKKMSYFFPIIFFFVLNSFPAALSFYYLVSNVVTIGQQLAVRKFIDEDKILAILEKNRKNFQSKPQKKNKFGDFLQKQLQASEEMKKKSEELKKTGKKK